MGKQKKANANAQRNNNVKEEGFTNTKEEFASYAEMEVEKMHHGKKTK